MNRKLAQTIVEEFYAFALTVNDKETPTRVLDRLLADDFRSVNSQEQKTKAQFSAQMEGVWKAVPDLKWSIQDTIFEGDKIVVRSIATGTPKGPFMGKERDGKTSFKMDTIDIHELSADNRVLRVHHLEDWATVMKQLG